jgi:urease accessory protein
MALSAASATIFIRRRNAPFPAATPPLNGFNLASLNAVKNDPPVMTPQLIPLPSKSGDFIAPTPASATRMQRARGVVRVAIRADGSTTRLVENYQSGSAKTRFPKVEDSSPLEVILVNTAGGVTGGDRLSYSVLAETGARGVVATQAAERIYRRSDGVARVETVLSVASGASLDWLPQETILFDRSALTRRLVADVDAAARLLAVEAIVLGRTAMGETARSVEVSDTWRIRRNGKLVFADGLRLNGDAVAIMAGGATGNGAAAIATLVLVAPDAETKLDAARQAIASPSGEAGVSAWNGILVARLIAATGQALRTDLMRLIETLRDGTIPRVWHC